MNNSLLTDPHQRKLLKKWGAILESGKPIENESTKIVLAQILENTRNYYRMTGQLNEAGVVQQDIVGKSGVMKGDGVMNGKFSVPYSGQTDNGDYYLPNVVMPMLRRIMPDLIANALVGVQPLNGPVGYALAYRPTYNGKGGIGRNTGLTTYGEIAYNPTDTRYTGTGKENKKPVGWQEGDAELDTTSEFWKAYGGNAWLGEGAGLGAETEFADLNKGEYPTVSFALVKSAVEAKTRKLAAHWSPELAEDMQAMHGIDVEREMVNTLTYEVGAEIDR